MSLVEIARRTGVNVSDLEFLLRGDVPPSVATRLGVPLLALQEFITRGEATASVAHRLGCSMAAAEDLARALGREGVIGIIVGLLLASSDTDRSRSAAAS